MFIKNSYSMFKNIQCQFQTIRLLTHTYKMLILIHKRDAMRFKPFASLGYSGKKGDGVQGNETA